MTHESRNYIFPGITLLRATICSCIFLLVLLSSCSSLNRMSNRLLSEDENISWEPFVEHVLTEAERPLGQYTPPDSEVRGVFNAPLKGPEEYSRRGQPTPVPPREEPEAPKFAQGNTIYLILHVHDEESSPITETELYVSVLGYRKQCDIGTSEKGEILLAIPQKFFNKPITFTLEAPGYLPQEVNNWRDSRVVDRKFSGNNSESSDERTKIAISEHFICLKRASLP